jgi:N6-adenosine-specific RNA methylase IME4
MSLSFPTGKWDIVYADPPWQYKRNFGGYRGAAENHYRTMPEAAIAALPVKSIMSDTSVLFMWVTGPTLDVAMRVLKAWGLEYRGVSYVWVKTTQQGKVMGGWGVMPTFTKPTTEYVLAATFKPRGRPFPILTLKQHQVLLAPRGRHSEKPQEIRDRIVELCGDRPRIELFARTRVPGWDAWGNEAPEIPAEEETE